MDAESSSAEAVPSGKQSVKTGKVNESPKASGSGISSDNENDSADKLVTDVEKDSTGAKRRRVSQREIRSILGAAPEVKMEGARRRKSLDQFEMETIRRLTVGEKEKLLEALETVNVNDVDELCRRIPSLTPGIIQKYIHGVMIRDHEAQEGKQQPKEAAPIQMWLKRAEDLVIDDGHDYSEALPEVFRALQLFELRHRLPPECANTTSLYNYLVAVFLGNKPPELGPAEACIMLQLMDCLANTLRSLDTAPMVAMLRERYDVMGRVLGARSHLRDLAEACTLENGGLLGELMQECEPPPTKKGKKGSKSGKRPTPTKQTSQANAGAETTNEQDEEKTQSAEVEKPAQQPEDAPGGEGNTGKAATDSASTTRSGRKSQAPERFTDPEAKKTRFFKTPLFSLNPFCFSPQQILVASSTDALASFTDDTSSLSGPKQPKARGKPRKKT